MVMIRTFESAIKAHIVSFDQRAGGGHVTVENLYKELGGTQVA